MHPASEGRVVSLRAGSIERQKGKKQRRKNKINFIWKLGKDSYLCTPNRKGKEKSQVADVMETGNEKIETDENTLRRIRLKRTAV